MLSTIKNKFIENKDLQEVYLEILNEKQELLFNILIEKTILEVKDINLSDIVYTYSIIDLNDNITHKETYFNIDKVLKSINDRLEEEAKTIEKPETKNITFEIDKMVNEFLNDMKSPTINKETNTTRLNTILNLQGNIVYKNETSNKYLETLWKFLNKNWKLVKNIDLSNLDATFIDKKIKFNKVNFENVNFENTDLSNVIFYNCNFKNVNFANTNFDWVNFDAVQFEKCYFSENNVTNERIFDRSIILKNNIFK